MAGTAHFTTGAEVSCSDGACGQVRAKQTHFLPKSGVYPGDAPGQVFSWPVSAVACTGDGIRLRITRQNVQDLPPAGIDDPDGSAGERGGHR